MAKKRKSKTERTVEKTERQPHIPNIEARPDIDEDAWGNDGMTFRQRSFVAAMIGPAGGNATKAAEMAGYSAENRNCLAVTGNWLLRNHNVQKALGLALAKRNISPEWVKNRLTEIAGSSMANFADITPEGMFQVDFKKAAAAGALSQIKEYDPETGKLKIHDAVGALSILAKIFGMMSDSQAGAEDVVIRRRPTKKAGSGIESIPLPESRCER